MFDAAQAIVLIGLFLVTILIIILAIRYSNKKHTERLHEIKAKVRTVEKMIDGDKKNKEAEKKELLKKIQSLERALKKTMG